jgi:hypothetical protein
MSSLPEHVHRVHKGSLHQVNGLAEAAPVHVLGRPFECGGRWWVLCRCEWIGSRDREMDLPLRCEYEQLAADFELDTLRAARIAHRERAELQRLAWRSA